MLMNNIFGGMFRYKKMPLQKMPPESLEGGEHIADTLLKG